MTQGRHVEPESVPSRSNLRIRGQTHQRRHDHPSGVAPAASPLALNRSVDALRQRRRALSSSPAQSAVATLPESYPRMSAADRRPATSAIIASLARVEGRKLVTHRIFLAGVAIALLGSGLFVRASLTQPGTTWDDDGWTVGVGVMLLAILTMVAANQAALRDRRSHAEEQHSMLPVAATTRTWGLLTAMLWPAAVATVLFAGVVGFAAAKGIVIDHIEVVQLIEGVCDVLLLGAAGVAIAAWFPNPFVAPMVGWALFLVTPDDVPRSWHSLTPFVAARSTELARWHLTYLVGLTAIFVLVAVGRSSRLRSLLLPCIIATGIVASSAIVLLMRACPLEGTCLF
jgi:hypothetical protein